MNIVTPFPSINIKANINTIQTADEVLGTLIDIKV